MIKQDREKIMKKMYQIVTSIQENGLFVSTAIVVRITNDKNKNTMMPDILLDSISEAGKTEYEARKNLKKELDLKGIDYKNFKL